MTSEIQLIAHDIHSLPLSSSSAGVLPQWPTTVWVVLPSSLAHLFPVQAFFPQCCSHFKHTGAAGEGFSSSSSPLSAAGRSPCWRGSKQVKEGCPGGRNWGSSFSASFVETCCIGVQLAAGQLCCFSDPWGLEMYISISHQWWECTWTPLCWFM